MSFKSIIKSLYFPKNVIFVKRIKGGAIERGDDEIIIYKILDVIESQKFLNT